MLAMAKKPEKRAPGRPKEFEEGRKPAYTIYARIDPALGKAVDAFIEQSRPKPTMTSLIETALEMFLEQRGHWPPATSDE